MKPVDRCFRVVFTLESEARSRMPATIAGTHGSGRLAKGMPDPQPWAGPECLQRVKSLVAAGPWGCSPRSQKYDDGVFPKGTIRGCLWLVSGGGYPFWPSSLRERMSVTG